MEFRDFLTLPTALVGATMDKLTTRYFVLAETQATLQTRVGHPLSGVNNPAATYKTEGLHMEPDKAKRETMHLSLQGVVREMIAIQYAVSKRPDALLSRVPLGMWDGR